MSSEKYQKAISIIKQHQELCGFCGGVSEELVIKAERTLEVSFPNSYRDFLLRFGAGNFGSTDILGVIDDDFYNSGIPDAVWYTLRLREEITLPRHLIVIHDTGGDGELSCLDTSKTNSPVVSYYIGYELEDQAFEIIANDFEDFLLKTVEFELEVTN